MVFLLLKGCNYVWSTQPKCGNVKGAGNVTLTAAIEMAGISFTKMEKFAKILNLKFPSRNTYYDIRGNYVFPEIDHSWKKEQQEQVYYWALFVIFQVVEKNVLNFVVVMRSLNVKIIFWFIQICVLIYK